MRTRKEVRALCARSLLHVPLIRIFLRFDRDDYLQKAIGWFGVLVVAGFSGCARRCTARRGVGYQNRPAGASGFRGAVLPVVAAAEKGAVRNTAADRVPRPRRDGIASGALARSEASIRHFNWRNDGKSAISDGAFLLTADGFRGRMPTS